MGLIRIANPATASEAALIESALTAAEIPYFLHGHGMAGIFPGVAVPGYNERPVMVPAACAEAAHAVIGTLHFSARGAAAEPARGGRWRLLLETVLFGWFIPGRARRAMPTSPANAAPNDDAAD